MNNRKDNEESEIQSFIFQFLFCEDDLRFQILMSENKYIF